MSKGLFYLKKLFKNLLYSSGVETPSFSLINRNVSHYNALFRILRGYEQQGMVIRKFDDDRCFEIVEGGKK